MNPNEELFANPQLNIQQLPDADQLVTVILEPAYKTVRYISAALTSVIITLITGVIFFSQLSEWPFGIYVFILVAILCIWAIIYSGMAYHFMGYALREKDISYSSGWLWRSMVTVPFNRVQHCEIKQGLIDRRFGLSRLTIYTAGGQSTDLTIPGLLPETAERLKSFILKSTEQSVDEA